MTKMVVTGGGTAYDLKMLSPVTTSHKQQTPLNKQSHLTPKNPSPVTTSHKQQTPLNKQSHLTPKNPSPVTTSHKHQQPTPKNTATQNPITGDNQLAPPRPTC